MFTLTLKVYLQENIFQCSSLLIGSAHIFLSYDWLENHFAAFLLANIWRQRSGRALLSLAKNIRLLVFIITFEKHIVTKIPTDPV